MNWTQILRSDSSGSDRSWRSELGEKRTITQLVTPNFGRRTVGTNSFSLKRHHDLKLYYMSKILGGMNNVH